MRAYEAVKKWLNRGYVVNVFDLITYDNDYLIVCDFVRSETDMKWRFFRVGQDELNEDYYKIQFLSYTENYENKAWGLRGRELKYVHMKEEI